MMNLRDRAKEFCDNNGLPYHNWRHVEACLAELAAARSLCERADLVEVAIWYHDVIYDPTKPDNEANSAAVAGGAMLLANCPVEDVRIVKQLILDTRHVTEPATNDGKLIVDIDLSILGKPPPEFAAYETAIRQEYAHVSDADFADGRAAVLRKFLDRPAIYGTAYFREKYEASARENLATSLRRWQSP